MVTTRRDGNRIYYRLTSGRVGELWAALRDVASAHFAELDALTDAYLGDRQGLEQIGRAELAQRLADGDVILVDVRPSSEYAAGHIAGARSIPVNSLQERLDELPDDVEEGARCRGRSSLHDVGSCGHHEACRRILSVPRSKEHT